MEQKEMYQCPKCGLVSSSPLVQYECPNPRCGYKLENIDYEDAYEKIKFEYKKYRNETTLEFFKMSDLVDFWEKFAIILSIVCCVIFLFLLIYILKQLK